MIPIDYTGDMSAYDQFCDDFKKKLDATIKKGYIGKRKEMSVAEAKAIMGTITAEQLKLFISSVGNGKIDLQTMQDTDKVLAPTDMLDDESLMALKYFRKLFDSIVVADQDEMCVLMSLAHAFRRTLSDRKKVYDNFYKVVVTGGYENMLPKNELIRATNTRVCPYCNRIFVEVVDGNTRTVKGQLDHFYPKERYPYLALSKYNLVPSCSYCNGASGKHDADPRLKHLVNPYFIKDNNGLVFRADVPRKGFLNLKTLEAAISIILDTGKNPNMQNNVRIFNLNKLYDTHKDYASETYFKYMKMSTKAYTEFTNRMMQSTGSNVQDVVSQISVQEWLRLVLGVYMDSKDQANRPLSKFISDLYNDFCSKGY